MNHTSGAARAAGEAPPFPRLPYQSWFAPISRDFAKRIEPWLRRTRSDSNCVFVEDSACPLAMVGSAGAAGNSSVNPPPTAPETIPAADHLSWFADEVHSHDGHLKAYLRGSFPAVRDVDDIVQESYLRVWRRQLANPITSAKGFLFKVARRLALDTLRHDRASPIDRVIELDVSRVIDNAPDVAESVCTHQEIELLLEAIESLPRRCREIVILRKLQGMPQKEIAARLGLSEQTVQVQARRGLRRCDEYMRRHGLVRP